VVLFAMTTLVLQAPRVDRVIFVYDGLSAKFGAERSPRSPAELAELARAQRRAFGTLDRLEQAARTLRIGPEELRRDAGRVMVPGMPMGFSGVGAAELLRVPGTTRDAPDPAHERNAK
jgi:hypothetical protein